jgi:uncharacterized repeat protein (TIGR03803 family)
MINRAGSMKRWASAGFLLLGLAGGFRAAAQCLPVPAGSIGFWPGDGDATDFVGSNNGTLNGNATATAAGFVGSAFSFDGTNSFVQIPDAPSLRPTNFTIETWVRFDNLYSASTSPGEQYLVFKQNTRTNSYIEGLALEKVINTNNQHVFHFVVIGAGGPPSAKVDSVTVVSTGVWYHVAAVRGPTSLQIFVNGKLESEASVGFTNDYGNFPLYFGSTGQSFYDGKLSGRLDEVTLYNRALGSNEIAAIYAAGAEGKCKPQTLIYTEARSIGTFLDLATGQNPAGGVIEGSDGALYGTLTGGGGFFGNEATNGTVCRLNKDGSGYAELWLFAGAPNDGADPMAGLIQDGNGSFYGTTFYGGISNQGTIFKLGNTGVNTYTNLILRHFTGANGDGANPAGSLLLGNDGLLYGTTSAGGSNDFGTVFKLGPDGSGYQVLRSFLGPPLDSASPMVGLAQGFDGLLYGTSFSGGSNSAGTLFKLNTNGGGYTVLKHFTGGGDGLNPAAELVLEGPSVPYGVMYGVTERGGGNSLGTVFKLNTDGTGYSVLESFTGTNGPVAGAQPHGKLLVGSDGLLYGTTELGGSQNAGVLFRLKRDGSGYAVLINFTFDQFHGFSNGDPRAGLLQGTEGGFYGSTYFGGYEDMGVIFSLAARPTNDNFASRIALSGPGAIGYGNNLNATAELGEPAHGPPGQAATNSVWWSWSGLPTGLVTLVNDGPMSAILDVYTGSVLSNLVEIASNSGGYPVSANRVSFTATAGSTYQICASGIVNTNGPLYAGSGVLSLSLRTLDLNVLSVTQTTNADQTTAFSTSIQIGNAGSASVDSLRVRLLAHAGYSKAETNGAPPYLPLSLPADQVLGIYPLTGLPAIGPGEVTNLTFAGLCPGPTNYPGSSFNDVGWGVFAMLEQQVGTNWFLADADLVLYGVWPVIGGFAGPGGGIIYIPPYLGNNNLPLIVIGGSILGPPMVAAGSTAAYYGLARFGNGTTFATNYFTNSLWTASRFTINSNGVFQAGTVTTNTPVTITGYYNYNGAQYSNQITISVVKPPSLSVAGYGRLPNQQFEFAVSGIPGSNYVIEAATNLATPATNWMPLATNIAGTNGRWLFTDSTATNFGRRFYRARAQ